VPRASRTSPTTARSPSSSRNATPTAGAPRRARRFDVLVALTVADLRVRYGRGPWRLLKWLLDPFALVGVFLVLVTVVLDRPGHAPGLSLACAVVPFQLTVMTVVNAMGAVALRRSIVLNMGFDRLLIPVSAACTEFVAFAASAVLLVGMMAIYGVAPTLAVLWLPVVVAVTVLVAAAFAFAASLFGLWFPELRPFGLSFVRTLFFLAPGLVPLAEIPSPADDLVKINPLSGLFESFRAVLLDGAAPALWMLAFPLAFAAIVLTVAVPLYRSEQAHFAKVLG
jgi:lipopolysaccharide transport system permease protein